jgi:hypothetical protein
LGTNPALLVLEVRGLLESTRYRLTINGIRDQSARANALNSNTEREFFTTELVPVNLGGNDARATMVQWVARGGFDVSARGGDISGTADSAGFAAQSLTGNFDLRVRVDGLTVTDPYMTAGLVVRSGIEAPFWVHVTHGAPADVWVRLEDGTVRGDTRQADNFTPPFDLDGRQVGEAQGRRIAERIAIVPILRAGLGMADGLLDLIPDAEVWHVGLYRDEATLQPKEYYNKLPANCGATMAIVVDPMLATGGSAIRTCEILQAAGIPRIIFLALIASPQGIERLARNGELALWRVPRHHLVP